MRKVNLLLFLVVSSLVVFSAGTALGFSAKDRALWIWNRANVVSSMLTNSEDQTKFFDFAKSPHNSGKPFNVLYIEARKYLSKDVERLASFIRRANDEGIRVYLLDGDPTWAVAYQDEALDRAEEVMAYNKKHDSRERFSGLVFDVEPYLLIKGEVEEIGISPEKALSPYLLPEWKTRRVEVEGKYLTLLERVMKKLSGSGLSLGAAVPLLFSEPVGGEVPLSNRVLDRVDFIVVMDYRDVSLRLIRDGKPFVDYANKIKKQAVIGVETIDLVAAGEGDNASTFAEEGWKNMEQELGKVVEVFKNSAGFGGVAVHYYNTLFKLQAEDTNKVVTDVPVIHAKRAPAGIKVDGNMEKWDKVPGLKVDKRENVVFEAERRWGGESDLSGEIRVMWDPDNIYLLLKVKDNKIVVTPSGSGIRMWAEDHVEVWFAPEAGYQTGIINDYQIGFSPGNFSSVNPFVISWVPEYLSEETTSKIKVASKKTADGYVIEAGIPAYTLGKLKPQKGKMMRFSVDFSDTDFIQAKQEILMSPTARVWGKAGTFAKLLFD